MTPEQNRRIDDALARAEQLPLEERDAFVRRELADDPDALAVALEALRPASTTSFLDHPDLSSVVGTGEEQALEGKTLGDFEIVERIDEGGTGIVYRARQISLDREAAVKVLHPSIALRGREREGRFESEAYTAGRLNHPGIVRVYATGKQLGVAYLAMEFLPGPSLAKELDCLARGEQPRYLPAFDEPDFLRAAVGVVAQAADALAAAHAAGVVHRDVKPGNLRFDADGRLRVLDFGLARDDTRTRATREGERAGTLAYMSPEQLRDGIKDVDARTDVYALGVVLYELLARRLPFTGTGTALSDAILDGMPPKLSKSNKRVPRELELVCETALAHAPRDRYASAAELHADLQRFLRGEAVAARAPALHRRTLFALRRHRVACALVAVAVFATLASVLFTRHTVRAADANNVRKEIEDVLALPEWKLGVTPIGRVRDELEQLKRRAPDAAEHLGEIATRFEERMSRYCAEEKEAAKALRGRGLGGRSTAFANVSYGTSDDDLGEAARRFVLLAQAFPSDAELAELARADVCFPRVHVQLSAWTLAHAKNAAAARVSARRIDTLDATLGAQIPLAESIAADAALPPGYWRIVVEIPDWGFAELDRWLVPGPKPREIVAHVPDTRDVTRVMKQLTAENFEITGPELQGCVLGVKSVSLDPYWIGEAEVSNREYLAFLADTGHSAPRRWVQAGYAGDWRALPLGAQPEAWLDLPVTGLNAVDARDYAEWAGARLPTHVELEYAQRGPALLRHVAEAADFDVSACALNIAQPSIPRGADPMDRFLYAATRLLPVRAGTRGQPPFGLFHADGNVAEYTSSMAAEARDHVLIFDPDSRLYLGTAADAEAFHQSLDAHSITGFSERYPNDLVGIRLARSAAP